MFFLGILVYIFLFEGSLRLLIGQFLIAKNTFLFRSINLSFSPSNLHLKMIEIAVCKTQSPQNLLT